MTTEPRTAAQEFCEFIDDALARRQSWAYEVPDEFMSLHQRMHDASLRSTSRDSEVREAIEWSGGFYCGHHGRFCQVPTGPHRENQRRWKYDNRCEVTDADHEQGAACQPLQPHSHRGDKIKWARPRPDAILDRSSLPGIGQPQADRPEAAPTHDRETCDCECHTDPDMDEDSCDGCTGTSEQERSAASEADRGSVSTTPSAPVVEPLDVDRLAEAVWTVYPFPGSKPARGDIERIAAEYARLTQTNGQP